MGHIGEKNIYRKLGRKIDNLTIRAPWNKNLYAILRELYSPEEAEVVVKMPFGFIKFEQIEKSTGIESTKLQNILESLCTKGLVMDIYLHGAYRYTVSPMVIGIFEFTMMRTGDNLNSREWARLFHTYMLEDDAFFAKNFKHGEKISFMRALPHEEAVKDSEHVEILDYEKAEAIIENSRKFSISVCSCRHEKLHLDKKECDVPLEKCSTLGVGTDYFIRHNLAKEVSKSEMLENLAQSKEMGLVLNADNVKKNVSYICHCCKCCCNILLGISKFGYPNIIVTSTFIAEIDKEVCVGCGVCVKTCPINAIEMITEKNPEIDKAVCLGCGVCALKCKSGALKLVKREQRILHPETTFQRIILQCLERGTLQNQIFKEPHNMSHSFMRGFIGGFLKLPPVKKALMSDMLRSSFLDYMEKRVRRRK